MSSTLQRSKDSTNKLNVFERLTMKKNNNQIGNTTRSTITTKSKMAPSIPQTSRSTIGPRTSQKKQEKDIQKLILPADDYKYITYPVEYAQSGFVIELESLSTTNVCRIHMDYNQYEVALNEIEHHFTMPFMSMQVKTVKVVLPEWTEKFSISLSRVKGKINPSKVEAMQFAFLPQSKDTIEIDPFSEIEQSQMRRKKMLLKQTPRLRMDKIHSKTQMDEVMEKQDFEQLYGGQTVKMKKKELLLAETPLGSPHRKMIKNDIFNLLTPRSSLLRSAPLRPKQEAKKQVSFLFPQSNNEISMFEQDSNTNQGQKEKQPFHLNKTRKSSHRQQKMIWEVIESQKR